MSPLSTLSRFMIIAILSFVGFDVVDASTNNNFLKLPALPYPDNALEPFISQKTLQYHHGKHHAKYVATTKSMIEGNGKYEKLSSLVDIMKLAHEEQNQSLFNNAAQSFNHEFYWNCMAPPGKNGGKGPTGILLKKINDNFGSLEEFHKEFANAGNTAFGSGWAWLVYHPKNDKLTVEKTIGADNPMITIPDSVVILCMDVWEHAYYLDYQNLRTSYVDTFLQKLINWKFVSDNLERAIGTSVIDGSGATEL